MIEDACHALGARRDGRPVGGDGLADMYVFSTHPVKAITTGEGGVVATDDDALADRLRTFRTHGIRRGGGEGVLGGGWHYDVESLGFNYRITDFQCALGQSPAAPPRRVRRPPQRDRRRATARCWPDSTGIALRRGARRARCTRYHLFVVRFTEGAARRRAVYDGPARARHRHAAALHPDLPPLALPLARLRRRGRRMPNTERYYEQALSLPMFPRMGPRRRPSRRGRAGRRAARERPHHQPVAQGAAAGGRARGARRTALVWGGDTDPECVGRYFTDRFWADAAAVAPDAAEQLLAFCAERGDRAASIPTRDGELPFFAALRDDLAAAGTTCRSEPRRGRRLPRQAPLPRALPRARRSPPCRPRRDARRARRRALRGQGAPRGGQPRARDRARPRGRGDATRRARRADLPAARRRASSTPSTST